MDNNRPGILWKVVPALFVLVLILAGGTDLFSVTVHQAVSKVLAELGGMVLPFAVNCVIGLVIISLANHLYKPLLKGVHKLLDSSHANARAKDLVRRVLKALYWLVVVFLVMSVVAPDLLGKLLGNLVLFGAAVVVALQDMAKDVAGGFILQFSPKRKFDIGDKIQVVGLDAVTGVVKDIDLLCTFVETEKGLVTVPNREMWSKAVIKLNPPASKLIMPPGVERPKPPEKPAGDPSGVSSNPLGLPNLLLGFGKERSDEPEQRK